MTIYAFGCSVTHGTELVTVTVSDENIALSYPNRIAIKLGKECKNYSIPGNSNECIFHNFMEIIPKVTDIDLIIVGWTSIIREVWYADGRYWQILPWWCSTTTDLTKSFNYIKNPTCPGLNISDPQIGSDNPEYLDDLGQWYMLLTKYKWNTNEYIKKRNHYVTAIRTYCNIHNLKLIETCWSENIDGVAININNILSPQRDKERHPNKEDHQNIANAIIDYYKL